MVFIVSDDRSPSLEEIRRDLVRLRRGLALARPTAVLDSLSAPVRHYLGRQGVGDQSSAAEVKHLVQTLRAAIEEQVPAIRDVLDVEFNLSADHCYPTLTERRSSYAAAQGCVSMTVRRQADSAVDTLAYQLLNEAHAPTSSTPSPANTATGKADSRDGTKQFWGLHPSARIDVVCSEIPADERPEYAAAEDRNYLRYAKFADLDTLIYLRTRFAQLEPEATVRDFAPSEHYATESDVLVVVGGPPWNAKYRSFLPQLPFHFEPHELGEDDPLVVPQIEMALGPKWGHRGALLEDLAVLTRLTLAQGTTVFLLGGCLTLGVLGAAYCLLEGNRGERSTQYLTDRVGEADFVLVTEARRVGGITDVADLNDVEPLLILTRHHNEPFQVITNNTHRYLGHQN
ncbi:hypothetical protein [Sciscionella marina]|uniref:hypothetical protein n=1 Tax=Sciscionella marina TaxID=508770 RepID=UPI0009FE225C|nr:hypothetical protein [Sciscionella marina]